MRSISGRGFLPICICAATLSGCTFIPDLPDEFEMPVQSILRHATCELRWAFEDFADQAKYPKFKADQWAIAISLTPKVDTEVSAKLGVTGKSTIDTKMTRFVTWTLGTSPGLEADFKGHRDGSVAFPIHSSQLLDRKHFPLLCPEGPGPESLTQYLGVHEWLQRLLPSGEDALGDLTHFDKPAFSSQIIVKFDGGNAGATWFIPNGTTYTPTLFASRIRDETLTIAFTSDPKKLPVHTLPEGAPIGKPASPARSQAVSPAALETLGRILQDETIRNLRLQSQ
jgi:hypothetical protein